MHNTVFLEFQSTTINLCLYLKYITIITNQQSTQQKAAKLPEVEKSSMIVLHSGFEISRGHREGRDRRVLSSTQTVFAIDGVHGTRGAQGAVLVAQRAVQRRPQSRRRAAVLTPRRRPVARRRLFL
jgi:hypothetical protein